MESIRVFLGIKIPKKLQQKIADIQNKLKKQNADVKWVEPENFHFNLKFFGHITLSKIKKIEQAVKKALPKHKPFEISIEDIGTFPSDTSPRVVWFGVTKGGDGIDSLANDLDKEFAKKGFEPENRPFKAHLTLGRVRSLEKREALIKTIKDLKHINIGTFKVNELVLFQSKLSRSGPIYTEYLKFKLSD